MLLGECYRFTEHDPDDGNIYLHYMDYDEVIAFIEIHYLISEAEDMRKEYMKAYHREVLNDYYMAFGKEGSQEEFTLFIKRCFRLFNINDIEKVNVKKPVHPSYILIGESWEPYDVDD
jgi:hypothetical protein